MERHKLPNGLEVFHINPGETRFLYAEIFEAGVYGRQGIALPTQRAYSMSARTSG
jgi:hypothetical protein